MSRTVKVRIAVAVTEAGDVVACGYGADRMDKSKGPRRLLDDWGLLDSLDDGSPIATVGWIEADFPIPETVVVKGSVPS